MIFCVEKKKQNTKITVVKNLIDDDMAYDLKVSKMR